MVDEAIVIFVQYKGAHDNWKTKEVTLQELVFVDDVAEEKEKEFSNVQERIKEDKY